jgi:protein-tyrosine phosphatase
VTRPIKTSVTHPLAIARVETPGGGVIGLTLCPGKRQPHAITGPWDRDLAADLAAISAFGARYLITLMEQQELVAAEVPLPTLRAAAEARGLTSLHWPIVDFEAPDPVFERRWEAEAATVCAHLSTGGTVVVHCRGGRGRSGLVAARLLVELGLPNETAILRVRTAEPLAIETPAQEEHVRVYRPLLATSRR